MKTALRRIIPLSASAAALCVVMCSNPEDQEPVRWSSAIQVPLVGGAFILGDELQKWIDDPAGLDSAGVREDDIGRIRVINADSTYYPGIGFLRPDTITGNIIAFSIADTKTAKFDYVQEKLNPKRFDVTIGPIPIAGAPQINQSVPVPAPGTYGPLPIAISMAPKVTYVGFASNSSPVTITVDNQTPGALSNVIVNVTGLGSATITSIPANSSGTATIPVAGSAVNATVNAQVSLTADAAGTVVIGFSLNGTTADSVTVQDSLVQFSRTYINDYDLTDSADIDYLDLADGALSYKAENHSGLSFQIRGVHHHMWMMSYSKMKGWNDLATLQPVAADSSLAFRGRLTFSGTGGGTIIGPRSTMEFDARPIAGVRMFPQWDSTQSRAETYVEYTVSTPEPRGQMLSFSSHDSVIFVITPILVQGREVFGRLMENFERESDTQDVAVDYPFDSAQIEQLRGKFFFDSVLADVDIRISLPGRAYMDSVDLLFEIYDPLDPSKNTRVQQKYGRMKNDTVFTQTLNVTPLVNTWPNTLKARAHALVPKGTEILVINDSIAASFIDTTVMGRMTIEGNLNFRIKPYFDYHVTMPTTITFGEPSSMDVNGMTPVRKLEERMARLFMNVENHTNVHIKLRGILAPDSNGSADGLPRDTILKTLGIDSMLRIVSTYHPDNMPMGYINLLDTIGLYIPSRGNVFDNNITLTENQIRTFVDSRKASTAWLLTFMTNGRDALYDTDSVLIKASIRVDGIVNTDSLFSSWEE